MEASNSTSRSSRWRRRPPRTALCIILILIRGLMAVFELASIITFGWFCGKWPNQSSALGVGFAGVSPVVDSLAAHVETTLR